MVVQINYMISNTNVAKKLLMTNDVSSWGFFHTEEAGMLNSLRKSTNTIFYVIKEESVSTVPL